MFRNHMIRDHVALSGPKGGECLQLLDASVTFFFGSDGHVANGQAYTDFREALREYTIHIRCASVTLVGSTPDN